MTIYCDFSYITILFYKLLGGGTAPLAALNHAYGTIFYVLWFKSDLWLELAKLINVYIYLFDKIGSCDFMYVWILFIWINKDVWLIYLVSTVSYTAIKAEKSKIKIEQ